MKHQNHAGSVNGKKFQKADLVVELATLIVSQEKSARITALCAGGLLMITKESTSVAPTNYLTSPEAGRPDEYLVTNAARVSHSGSMA
jgi:hypothetical protein